MTFAVLPAHIADIEEVYDVYFDAFRDELINKVFFPQGTDGEDFKQHHAAAVRDWWHKTEFDHTFKCIEIETGKIVGMAIWSVFWRGRDSQERPKPEIPWLGGDHRRRAEGFAVPFWKMKEELFGGDAYIYCHVLAVHPDYQRRGIGQLLTRWGIDTAEQMSLPIYVESTTSALKLYKKMGFQQLSHTVRLSPEVTGQDEDLHAPILILVPTSMSKTSKSEPTESAYSGCHVTPDGIFVKQRQQMTV